ncbi:Fic family protein [Candidatus Bathyarchaeota archaeon]|nr:Fic family protein [Candidatus Bathyarchaeota archaeon]
MPLINQRIHRRLLEKKARLDAHRPFPPGLVRRLRGELMIEYTYDSNAIEGSTLTLRETRLVIEEGVTVGGKSLGEHLAARNHPEAIRYMEGLVGDGGELGEEDVLRLHQLVLQGIEEDAGRFRSSGVRIAGATFSPPPSGEVRKRVRGLLSWLEGNPEEYNPIELAAVFHHRFVQIHPFSEGNGRTARLLMNLVLMRHGYPFIVNITSRDRGKYLRALSEADMGDPATFVDFAALSVERALDVYLQVLEEPRLMTLAEASRLVPYSQEYLSLLARRGTLWAFKKGRNWVISREDLERYIQSVKKGR